MYKLVEAAIKTGMIYVKVHSTYILACDDAYLPIRSGNHWWEYFHAVPLTPGALYLYITCIGALGPLLSKYRNFVTLSRLTCNRIYALACDYCSIINGALQCAHEELIKDPSRIALCGSLHPLKWAALSALFFREDNNVPDDVVDAFCLKHYRTINDDLRTFATAYLLLEKIELRWCPFKAAVDYYRNSDPRFFPSSSDYLYYVGLILDQYDQITCDQCNYIINEQIDSGEPNKEMAEVVELICQYIDSVQQK